MQTRLSEQAAEWSRAKSDDLLLRGVALDEALAWRARTPKGSTVPGAVNEYLNAGEAVEARRKAEAQANIAEREEALTKAQTATRNTQRVTMIGFAVAVALIAFAALVSWTAVNATRIAGDNRANLFASVSSTRFEDGVYPQAMRMALAGDPAAQNTWIDHAITPIGHSIARAALVRAVTHNRVVRSFDGHTAEITKIQFSADGRRVLTASGDGVTKLWDVASGHELRSLRNSLPQYPAALSPDGRRILYDRDVDAVLVDADNGSVVWTIAGPHGPSAFSADGSRALHARYLLDARTGRVLREMNIEGSLYGSAFSPNGSVFALSKWNFGGAAIEIRDSQTGSVIRTFPGDRTKILNALSFSSDGRHVLACGSSECAMLDVESGQSRTVGRNSRVGVFSADGLRAMIATDEIVMTAPAGTFTGSTRSEADTALQATLFSIRYVSSGALSRDGRHIVLGLSDGIVQLLDAAPRPPARTFRPQGQPIAVSSNGRRLLIADVRNELNLWDADTGRPLRSFERTGCERECVARTIALSADGARALTGADSGAVLLWNAETGTRLRTYPHGGSRIGSVAFSADGRRVFTADYGESKVWETETGRLLRTLPGRAPAALSPDGRRVLAIADEVATLWDVDTGEKLHTFRPARTLAFSPDGRFLATMSSSD